MSRSIFRAALPIVMLTVTVTFGQSTIPAGIVTEADQQTAAPRSALELKDCPPATTCGPHWWAQGEYVAWTIGTGKLVEIGLNAYDSSTFNSLLALTGKNYRDIAQRLLGDDRTGYRLAVGGWLNNEETLGVEASFLRVSRGPLTFALGLNRDFNPLERIIPNGNIAVNIQPRNVASELLQRAGFAPSGGDAGDSRLLALFLKHSKDPAHRALFLLSKIGLPGIDTNGREVVIPYGARDLANGSALVQLAEQTFWALDLLGRGHLMQSDGLTVDAIAGYRRVYYSDALTIHSQTVTLSRPLLPGTVLRSVDAVRTENTYDGALVGVDAGWCSGNWNLSVRATATPAYYQADVVRVGAKTITLPDGRRFDPSGGTYLRSSDVGSTSANGWTVISEVGFRATRNFGDYVSLTLGASLLYMPDAARAAPQLPLGIDPDRALPGRSASPQVHTAAPDLRAVFLNTMSAGLIFHY